MQKYNDSFNISKLLLKFLYLSILCALFIHKMPSLKSSMIFSDAFIINPNQNQKQQQRQEYDQKLFDNLMNDQTNYYYRTKSNQNDFDRKLSSTIVKIKYGLLQGLIVRMDKNLENNRKFNDKSIRLQPIKAYLGIPYASPPTGALRFMPPVTPTHWRGIRLANELQPLCPQRIPFLNLVLNQTTSTEALKLMPLSRFEWLRRIIPLMLNQSEDCLYLNIYTPNLSDNEWLDISNDDQNNQMQNDDNQILSNLKVNKNDGKDNNNDYHHQQHRQQRQPNQNKKHENQAKSSSSFNVNDVDEDDDDDDDGDDDNNNDNDDEDDDIDNDDTRTISNNNNNNDEYNDESNNNNKNHNNNNNNKNDDADMYNDDVDDDDGIRISEENTLDTIIRIDNNNNDNDGNDNNNNQIHLLNKRESSSSSLLSSIHHQINNHHHQQHQECNEKSKRHTSMMNNETKRRKKFPVIIFLTGESYEWNPGSLYDGSILASFGQAIVVTLNFRLGILGFLPANIDGTMRGNYGLMDQVAALHWIHENVAEFGGQSDNITIVGHGYGASLAHLLMLSPMAKGLFNRVILMSGSALSPWAIARDSNVYAEQIGKQLNCSIKKNSLIIDCLRTKTIDQLQSVDYQVPDHLAGFGPIIDGIVIPQEPRILMYHIQKSIWLRQHFQNQSSSSSSSSWSTLSSSHIHRMHTSTLTNSKSNNHIINIPDRVSTTSLPASQQSPQQQQQQQQQTSKYYWTTSIPDLMVGITKCEIPTAIFSSHEERNGISVTRRDRLLRTLVRNLYDYHQQAIFYTLINEYTDWTKSSVEHPLNLMDSLIELFSDALIVASLIESLDHHYIHSSSLSSSSSTTKTSNSYFYVFEYQNELFTKQSFHERLGASYGDDLAYIFGVPFLLNNYGDNYFFTQQKNFNYDSVKTNAKIKTLRYPILDISSNWYPSSSSSSSSTSSITSTTTKLAKNNETMYDLELCQQFITSWINFAIRGDPNYVHNDNDDNNDNDSIMMTKQRQNINKYQTFDNNNNHNQQQQQQQKYSLQMTKKTHDQWIRFYGYQTIFTSKNSFTRKNDNDHMNDRHHHHQQQSQSQQQQQQQQQWPRYDATRQRYVHFGQSSVDLKDHYNSHRLSIWLSLIPRLHVPIELKQQDSTKPTLATNDLINDIDGDDSDSNEFIELNNDEYFYLKHHLLPAHENFQTYDGVVRELPIHLHLKSPKLQRKYMRQNISSIYEQKQQLLYGKIYDTINTNILINDNYIRDQDLNSFPSSIQMTQQQLQQQQEQQQHNDARRQIINDKNKILIPQLIEHHHHQQQQQQQQQTTKENKDFISKTMGKNNSYSESTSLISAHQIPSTSSTKILTATSTSTSTSSSSSFVSETYGTLVYISFIIGGLLFILNLIIVIGVYLQMKNGRLKRNNGRHRHRHRQQQQEQELENQDDQSEDLENDKSLDDQLIDNQNFRQQQQQQSSSTLCDNNNDNNECIVMDTTNTNIIRMTKIVNDNNNQNKNHNHNISSNKSINNKQKTKHLEQNVYRHHHHHHHDSHNNNQLQQRHKQQQQQLQCNYFTNEAEITATTTTKIENEMKKSPKLKDYYNHTNTHNNNHHHHGRIINSTEYNEKLQQQQQQPSNVELSQLVGATDSIFIDANNCHHYNHHQQQQNLFQTLPLLSKNYQTTTIMATISEQSTPLKSILKNSSLNAKNYTLQQQQNQQQFDTNLSPKSAAAATTTTTYAFVDATQDNSLLYTPTNDNVNDNGQQFGDGNNFVECFLTATTAAAATAETDHNQQYYHQQQSSAIPSTTSAAAAATTFDDNHCTQINIQHQNLSQLPYITLTEMYQRQSNDNNNQDTEIS